MRDTLEANQIAIYFTAALAGALIGWLVPGARTLEGAINPALALMLFVTFLQLPLAGLGEALRDMRFVGALLAVNFLLVPVIVGVLLPLAPADPLIRLGVLIVLLCPCIDYVVTFTHLGKGNAKLLLASTPLLLVVQMALLPLYLRVFLGEGVGNLVEAGPFLHAFAWLIAAPLALAFLCQAWAQRSLAGARVADGLGVLPVPATALVLLVVLAAVVPQLNAALAAARGVLPVYAAFAVIAPLLAWLTGRAFRLTPEAARTVAFSGATRNSLVVLPLAMAVPGALPMLPAVIVTQTMVELIAELFYVRLMPLLGGRGRSRTAA